jgi:glutamyl-tRNA(Gln) amidotransferase subunit E
MKDYGLNQKLAKQILDSEYSELFETIIKESDVSPITVTAFLTETLRALKRDGIQVNNVSEKQIREIFKHVSTGELTKEAIPEVVGWLSKHEGKNIQEAVTSLGLKILSEEELMKIVGSIVENNKKIVEERGMEAFDPLMSLVMKEVRGKANPALVSELIRKKLKQIS